MGLPNSTIKHPSETRILMLGLDGSGKSTLLYKLKFNETVVTVPTVGFNVEMLKTKEKGFALTVWDVGGQHRMRAHWRHYYDETAGLVFVVDSKDEQRMAEARQELEKILANDRLKDLPLIVLANKQDLPEAASAKDVEEILNLKEICGERRWLVQPCSARTGEGLEDCFCRMVHLLKASVVEAEDGDRTSRSSLKQRNSRTASSVKSRS